MTAPTVAPGTVTGVGSLPHTDVDLAIASVLADTPLLPAAPQLPHRHPAEGMLSQAAAGVPGLDVDKAGRLLITDSAALRAITSEDDIDVSFAGEPWAAFRAFAAACGARRRAVKLQLTGPLTFGLALVGAGLAAEVAFSVAQKSVRARAKALERTAREAMPGAPLVIMVDEPALTTIRSPGFPLRADDTIDLLSAVLAAFGPDVVTGIHCCGPTDWRLPIQAGPDVLSLPVSAGIAGDPAAVGPFLERGGWVAWGVVPTSGPVGEGAHALWRRLIDVWCELTRGGCDPVTLRHQALVTPECGLAGHDPDQVATIFELACEVGGRIEDQAVACRLSVGA